MTDRLDAMRAFVEVVDCAGFAAAARRLGQSPASVTRAVAALETQFGVRLLQRTTRSVRLTEAGQHFADACRRILADVEDTERAMSGESATPKGTLVVTAPVLFGRLKVLPQVDAFLKRYPDVRVRLLLLDRIVNLVDEGVDVAVRLAHLPESSLVAVPVGEVRGVVCASPRYLASRPPIRVPDDLLAHDCIAVSQLTANDAWPFGTGGKGRGTRHLRIHPRLTVNSAEAAVASCAQGRGVTYVLSYQVADEIGKGRIVPILESFQLPPVPVQVVFPEARMAAAKTRAFVDLLVPALRLELGSGGTAVRKRATRRS